MSQLFQISNLLVMPFWVLMIVLPNWSWSRRIMASTLIVVPIAVLYSSLVIPNFAALLPLLANPQLDVIAGLLSTPSGATSAWIHFLAFDLWTGRWVYSDSQQVGIPTWLTSLCLICVFMVGPFGLLLYVAVRRWHRGTFSV